MLIETVSSKQKQRIYIHTMKKQIILSLILFFTFLVSNAQVKINDNYNHNPISNVKIFSKAGRILAFSNLKGIANISTVDFPKNDSIEIYHSNYVSQKMTWNDIIKSPQIYLNPDPVTKLDEVVLTAKNPEYLLLKGYFISYQIIDDVAISFSDGIIEYYINLGKEKVIDARIIESRTFKNTDYIKAFKERKGNSSFNVLSTVPPFNFKEEVLLSDWNKYKIYKGGVIKRKDDIIGRISNDSNKTEFTIEYYSPQNTKKVSLFGITSVIKNKTIYEKFNSTTPKVEEIAILGKYYNSDITQKGVTVNYELIEDFYTMEKKFLSKAKFKDYLSKKENEEQYNLYLGNKSFSVIPEYIELLLYNELDLISNPK